MVGCLRRRFISCRALISPSPINERDVELKSARSCVGVHLRAVRYDFNDATPRFASYEGVEMSVDATGEREDTYPPTIVLCQVQLSLVMFFL